MTRIKKLTVVLCSLCLLLIILVGCTNEKQYFEQGMEVDVMDFYGERTIVYEFDENSLGEEYAEKYNNFCKVKSKEQYFSDNENYWEFYRVITLQSMRSHTLKGVADVPSTTQVVYFNGRKSLGKGEVLVHKWTYYTFLANTFGFYIDDDLAKKILDSDDVLSKYIAMLECNLLITELGLPIDYYGYSSVLDEKIGKKEMPIMLCDSEKFGYPEAEYKEYIIAGYYIDEADYDYLNITYDKEQFCGLEIQTEATETEKAISKKLDEIEDAFYVR